MNFVRRLIAALTAGAVAQAQEVAEVEIEIDLSSIWKERLEAGNFDEVEELFLHPADEVGIIWEDIVEDDNDAILCFGSPEPVVRKKTIRLFNADALGAKTPAQAREKLDQMGYRPITPIELLALGATKCLVGRGALALGTKLVAPISVGYVLLSGKKLEVYWNEELEGGIIIPAIRK